MCGNWKAEPDRHLLRRLSSVINQSQEKISGYRPRLALKPQTFRLQVDRINYQDKARLSTLPPPPAKRKQKQTNRAVGMKNGKTKRISYSSDKNNLVLVEAEAAAQSE